MNTLNPQAPCPCGQDARFSECCQPVLLEQRPATSAEALMRSRYSAHVCGAIDYLMNSWWPEVRNKVNRDEVARWVEESEWLRLEIIKTEQGQTTDTEGWVEFIAHYRHQGRLERHGERSFFRQLEQRWYFVDGVDLPESSQPKKLGRNDPCPCGSGKKLKRCCG